VPSTSKDASSSSSSSPGESSGAPSSSSSSPAESSTTSPPYSCKAKATEAAEDASEPYDCNEGLWDWARGWTDAKKEWCCTNQLLWCPEWASTAAVDTSDWSADQKDYCCKTENVGCPAAGGVSKFAVPLRRAVGRRTSLLSLATALMAAGTLALGVVAYRRGVRGGLLEGRGALAIYAPILRDRVQPSSAVVEPYEANDMSAPLN
jgi:hypothetical protein